jgi:hypothetical protein
MLESIYVCMLCMSRQAGLSVDRPERLSFAAIVLSIRCALICDVLF